MTVTRLKFQLHVQRIDVVRSILARDLPEEIQIRVLKIFD